MATLPPSSLPPRHAALLDAPWTWILVPARRHGRRQFSFQAEDGHLLPGAHVLSRGVHHVYALNDDPKGGALLVAEIPRAARAGQTLPEAWPRLLHPDPDASARLAVAHDLAGALLLSAGLAGAPWRVSEGGRLLSRRPLPDLPALPRSLLRQAFCRADPSFLPNRPWGAAARHLWGHAPADGSAHARLALSQRVADDARRRLPPALARAVLRTLP